MNILKTTMFTGCYLISFNHIGAVLVFSYRAKLGTESEGNSWLSFFLSEFPVLHRFPLDSVPTLSHTDNAV